MSSVQEDVSKHAHQSGTAPTHAVTSTNASYKVYPAAAQYRQLTTAEDGAASVYMDTMPVSVYALGRTFPRTR